MRIDITPGVEESLKDQRQAKGKNRRSKPQTPSAGKPGGDDAGFALTQAGDVYQQLLQALYDAALIVTPTGAIVDSNCRAREFLLASHEELCAAPLAQVLCGASQDLLEDVVDHLRHSRFVLIQAYCRRRDQTVFPAEVAVSYLPWREPRLCLFIRDTTIRKQEEEELRAAKELAEAANRAKSEFLANVSHDIRNPMNGVLCMAEMLLESELTVQQREYLETILDSGHMLLDLLNDILDLSKIEAGQLDIEDEPFEIREIVEKVRRLHTAQASEKGLHLEARYEPNVPCLLCGDAARLRQVLMNLVGNAVKFTERGTVTVALTAQPIADDPGRILLVVQVCDTGPGIPTKDLDRVFEKFRQADSAATKRAGGTGLGLAISRQLVTLMGGRITVASQEGVGTTFTFEVPLATAIRGAQPAPGAPAAADTPPPLPSPAPRAAYRVLLAEDSQANQRVAKAILESLAIQVETVTTGQDAIQRLVSDPYDMVLMDNRMPVMDGFEATRRIRQGKFDLPDPKDAAAAQARERLRRIPIVAVTADAMKGDREKCVAAGMDDYLAKPISRVALLRVLHKFFPDLNVAFERNTMKVLILDPSPERQRQARVVLGHYFQPDKIKCAAGGIEGCALLGSYLPHVMLVAADIVDLDVEDLVRFVKSHERYRSLCMVILVPPEAGARRAALGQAGADVILDAPLIREAFERALLSMDSAPAEPPPAPKGAANDFAQYPCWAVEEGLHRVGDDAAMLQVVAEGFLEDIQRILPALRDRLAHGDGPEIRTLAHGLKGAAASVAGNRVRAMAIRLEELAAANQVDQARQLWIALQDEADKLASVLRAADWIRLPPKVE